MSKNSHIKATEKSTVLWAGELPFVSSSIYENPYWFHVVVSNAENDLSKLKAFDTPGRTGKYPGQ